MTSQAAVSTHAVKFVAGCNEKMEPPRGIENTAIEFPGIFSFVLSGIFRIHSMFGIYCITTLKKWTHSLDQNNTTQLLL